MFDQFEHYRPTHLESSVVDFYQKNRVRNPQDINLEMFAYDAGIWIHYSSVSSTHYELDRNRYSIILDDRLPREQQRVELAHELGHVLLHAGRQEFMADDFRALQEWQADRFAMYALAPTFMIANCCPVPAHGRQQFVHQLAHCFDVPDTFMDVRLDMLEQRFHSLEAEKQLALAVNEACTGYDYAYRHPTNHRVEYLVKNGWVVGKRHRADI